MVESSAKRELDKAMGTERQIVDGNLVQKRIYEQGFRYYVVERDDGGISVFTLIDDPNIEQFPVIEDEIKKWEEALTQLDPSHRMCGVKARNSFFALEEAFPKNAAWLQDAFAFKSRDRIDIDVERAKPIFMDLLRRTRNEKLQSMDIPFMMSLEVGGNDTKSLAAQKRILRDLPATLLGPIMSAQTLEQLFGTWPQDQLGEFPMPIPEIVKVETNEDK
jgi:hypothetical protein